MRSIADNGFSLPPNVCYVWPFSFPSLSKAVSRFGSGTFAQAYGHSIAFAGSAYNVAQNTGTGVAIAKLVVYRHVHHHWTPSTAAASSSSTPFVPALPSTATPSHIQICPHETESLIRPAEQLVNDILEYGRKRVPRLIYNRIIEPHLLDHDIAAAVHVEQQLKLQRRPADGLIHPSDFNLSALGRVLSYSTKTQDPLVHIAVTRFTEDLRDHDEHHPGHPFTFPALTAFVALIGLLGDALDVAEMKIFFLEKTQQVAVALASATRTELKGLKARASMEERARIRNLAVGGKRERATSLEL
ncbi:hypothetical protein P7C73_g2991, partial [Tremellales sp. Uapishka_1]